jgi:opacity protein-like surface antigen
MRTLTPTLLLCTTLACQIGHALVPNNGPAIHLYGGLAKAISAPKSLFFDTIYPERDTLVKNSNSGQGFTGGFGLSYDILNAADYNSIINQVSLGLDFYFFNTNIKGDVLQFGDPELNNLTYEYGLNTIRFMFDGQLDFHPIHQVVPFILAGIGPSSIKAKYYDVPRPSEQHDDGGVTLPTSTRCSLAYSVGAGFKVPLSKKIQISLSYLYTDIGTGQTGSIPVLYHLGRIEPISIKLRTQSGLIGLTYTLS